MSIHHKFPRALEASTAAPGPAGGATTHGNPPATYRPATAGSLDELRAIAVRRGVEMLVRPSAEARADARMRGGMLARVTEERWIDRQPLIDKLLFWAVLACCWGGGGALIAIVAR